MRCPFCGEEDTKVIDSRSIEGRKKRRRMCAQCGKRFTTFETVERPMLMVAKRDVDIDTVNDLVDEIESELANEMVSTVSPDRIGQMVLDRLRKIDVVAYVRFASVYQKFSDIDDFVRIISEVRGEGK